MKQLTCEMCGSTDLMKQDGVFVCQTCGTKYSVEEAKKMMVEGTVEVAGTVKVDDSDKVKNLYIMARRAKDEGNAELASKYYEMITFENPNDWEALFYFNYFKASQTNLKNLENSLIRLANSLDSVFDLIDKSNKTSDEKWNLAKEIIAKINNLCESCIYSAKSHYRKFSKSTGSLSELGDRTEAVAELQHNMADLLEKYYTEDSKQAVADYLKSYVNNYLLLDTTDRAYTDIILKYYSNELVAAENRIKNIEPDYKSIIDKINKEKSDAEESAKEMQNNETADNEQNSGETIQVNYQVGHYDISDQWHAYPNSAGGNSVRLAIKNTGTKPIKYYRLCFAPYNAVGDMPEPEKWFKGTGPIAPNSISGERYFENVWYNYSIESVKLVEAEIEYMDGTKKTIQGDQISSITNTTANSTTNNPMAAKIDFYCKLIGCILCASLAGLLFVALASSGLALDSTVLFAWFFEVILFICPCVLLIRLIKEKIKK